MLGQELSPEEERQHAELVQAAKIKERDALGAFGVFESRKDDNISKKTAWVRWVLTSKMMDGRRRVEARFVPKDYEDPALQERTVDTSGCVSLGSSHLQVTSLRAVKKWKLRSLDVKNAFLQADGFTRNVCLQAPNEWEP